MKRLVFLGAPGAGKGTQAKILAENCNLAHISTGDMLRQAVSAGSELGAQVKTIMEEGKLVPDELMVAIIKDRIAQEDCREGYILDGFPRTVPQAESLKKMLQEQDEDLSNVVLFDVSDEDLRARLENRRGEEARKDDSAEVQLERLRVYKEQTEPLIAFYESAGMLSQVSGAGSVEEVQERLQSALGA